MGCGISKLDFGAEGKPSPDRRLSSVDHRRNESAVVDSSLLPEAEGGSRREEHAKGDVIQHDEKGRVAKEEEEASDMDDGEEDEDDVRDISSYPRSPSFRVYCAPSLSDDENKEGDR
ncbi:hypothetical protein PTKIN_Ptkin07bG0005400 [Pterospermum kingtungense]